MPNRNTLWSSIFVDELARSGLTAVCIAPGSRSTPLTVAFAAHEAIQVYSHLDERSAGFFALGLALASDRPVALVCTSGTAAANFLPAIIEANMSRVPLLVLTTDRPHELRHSGANQTIDQVKLYGDQVLWSVDAALPEAEPPAVALRNLRTLAARAYARANGLRKGPVHINLPFRKPLEPTPVEGDMVDAPPDASPREMGAPYTGFSEGLFALSGEQLEGLGDLIVRNTRGIIVCGPGCPGGNFPIAVAGLAHKAGYPLFADPISGLRFGADSEAPVIVGSYDSFLASGAPPWGKPDVVLRFGNVPISKPLNDYLNQPGITTVHIRKDGEWADDSHRTAYMVQADEAIACTQLVGRVVARSGSGWARQITAAELATRKASAAAVDGGDLFDGAIVRDVVDLLPPDSTLFMGNSLPIRHLDQFGTPTSKLLYAYANRGASGIDGNISTALGAGAAQPHKPLAAVVGDITLYHDMNGLLAVQRCGIPATIVLLNNNGGGIFHRLPIKNFDPPFTDLFITAHGLQFEHAARLYGLDYVLADTREAFRDSFAQSIEARGSTLIEVRTDALHDLDRRRDVIAAVKDQLSAL